MEQFSLEKYLENPNHKIVTRDGRPVRIVCWDLPGEYKIIGVTDESDDGYTVINKKTDGTGGVSTNDIFFAEEEEEELTEFESAFGIAMMEVPEPEEKEEWYPFLKKKSAELLELAKEELKTQLKFSSDIHGWEYGVGYEQGVEDTLKHQSRNDYLKHCGKIEAIEQSYTQGKADALKSIPKWKKATSDKEFNEHFLLFKDEKWVVLTTKLYKGDYYIKLSDLKKLPKEE